MTSVIFHPVSDTKLLWTRVSAVCVIWKQLNSKQWFFFHFCAWHVVREYIRSENLDLPSCPFCNPDVSHHVASPCTVAWQTCSRSAFAYWFPLYNYYIHFLAVSTFATLHASGSCGCVTWEHRSSHTHSQIRYGDLKRSYHSLSSN